MKPDCIVHNHTTSWHDGCVAVLTPTGELVALASERVGDRTKHCWDSRLAYEHLRRRVEYAGCFGGARDHFLDTADGLENADHHLFHASSTFFASGFDRAAVLVVDGQGPREGRLATTTIWRGDSRRLELVEEMYPAERAFAPQSIGHFYTAIGALCGMSDLYEEGKTMALAAYGEASPFLEWLRRFVRSEDDGTYVMDPRFVLAVLGNTLGPRLYGWERQPSDIQAVWDDLVTQFPSLPVTAPDTDPDVAFAGQTLLEEMVRGLARRARRLTRCTRLCLAGGVALNCAANEAVVQDGEFDDVFVFPAPSDDGQALGKLFMDVAEHGPSDVSLALVSPYLGPRYSTAEVEAALAAHAASCRYERLDEGELIDALVDRLCQSQVVASCFGRSELGPRALGHRSIFADARLPWMREHLNQNVKSREWYRPVAPIVLEEHAAEYFFLSGASPFMARAVALRPEVKSRVPSAMHVDGTGRLQTVSPSQDPRCHAVLARFHERTGIPMLINTSFNRRGEPLVESHHDALAAFEAMNIDALMLGDYLVVKRAATDVTAS